MTFAALYQGVCDESFISKLWQTTQMSRLVVCNMRMSRSLLISKTVVFWWREIKGKRKNAKILSFSDWCSCFFSVLSKELADFKEVGDFCGARTFERFVSRVTDRPSRRIIPHPPEIAAVVDAGKSICFYRSRVGCFSFCHWIMLALVPSSRADSRRVDCRRISTGFPWGQIPV